MSQGYFHSGILGDVGDVVPALGRGLDLDDL